MQPDTSGVLTGPGCGRQWGRLDLLPQPWLSNPQGCLREEACGLHLQVFPSSLSLPTILLCTNPLQILHSAIAHQVWSGLQPGLSLTPSLHWLMTSDLPVDYKSPWHPSDKAIQPEKVPITKTRNCSHAPNLEKTTTILKTHSTFSGLSRVFPRAFIVQKLIELATQFWGSASDDLWWKGVVCGCHIAQNHKLP